MAEAILGRRLAGVPELVPVTSAGLLSGGSPADPDAVSVLAERGLDVSAHLSQRLTAGMLEEADLVLGMERRHVGEAVLISPSVFPRAFAVRELVRRGRERGPRRVGQPLREWLTEVAVGRVPADLFTDPSDDVADPIGIGRRSFIRLADELTGLAEELAVLVEDHRSD